MPTWGYPCPDALRGRAEPVRPPAGALRIERTAAVYLRALLLTGARREEMAALRWENVDFRWRKLMLADDQKNTGASLGHSAFTYRPK